MRDETRCWYCDRHVSKSRFIKDGRAIYCKYCDEYFPNPNDTRNHNEDGIVKYSRKKPEKRQFSSDHYPSKIAQNIFHFIFAICILFAIDQGETDVIIGTVLVVGFYGYMLACVIDDYRRTGELNQIGQFAITIGVLILVVVVIANGCDGGGGGIEPRRR